VADRQLDVHVVTPEEEVWRGPAEVVVATGVDGQLGILPGHAPLLTLLGDGPLEIRSGGSTQHATVRGGFLHVFADRVDVLAESAELGG
jgi:F-type H+-transporting ATPase subunit epsilon